MTVYHWLVVLILLLSLLMRGEKKGNIIYILLISALMFSVYGLRDAYTIGGDSSSSYLHHFEEMKDVEWEDMPTLSDWVSNNDHGEERAGHDRSVGFEWLMKCFYDWTDGDYQWFVGIIAFFVTIAVAQFVLRYSPSPVQSFLYYMGLLFYATMFNILKQSIAMGIILLSFNEIVQRKPVRFLLLVLFASLFHFPALVFLPAYWIANMKLEKTYLVFLGLLFAVTYLFRTQLVDLMTDTYDTVITETGRSFFANKVLIMLLIIVAALVIRPPSKDDKIYSMLLMLTGVATVIQTFSSYNNTFERLANYYFLFSIVLIPMVFEDAKLKRRHLSDRELTLVRRIGPLVFGAFAIWRFLYFATSDPMFSPYQFYFQVQDAPIEELLMWRFL